RQTAEQEIRDRLSRAEEESAEVESRLTTLSEQAAASDRTLSGSRSRLELLTSMRARHEGTDQAVQKVLVEAAREGTSLPGVVGIVADVLKVVGPDVEAVELALGACSQGIVTETLDDALRAIEWLKEKRLGRALFIPLTEVREAGPTYGGNGIARSALESVDADERFLPLVRALLSDSILVEDVDRAREVADDVGRLLRIVTGGGEVLNRIGTITGGLGRSPRALLTRNAEIEKLKRDVAQEEERSAALAEALETTRASIRDLRSELRVLREEIMIAARETREAEAAADRTRRDLARLDEEEQVLRKETQELDREREEHGARDEELALLEEELNLEEEDLRAQSETLEDAFRLAREGVKSAVEQQTEVRVALARSRERLAGADSRIQALARGEEEAERNLELFHTEKESTSRRRDQVLVDADVAARDAEEGEQRREKMIKDVAVLRKRHGEAREKLLERRREADDLREEHDKYRGTLEEFRLKESENRLKVEGLLERVRDEFDLDLEDQYQGFTPEEVDWEALDQEVTDLRQKIDRMGNVNLEALDQLTEVDERVKFLKEQEADLLRSRETLLDILRKVNRESRERFEKAFSEIRQHFREMYRKLFGGGNAEIILEEGQDVLEAGIEIVVRPPGRELQNLNLLSGGEKTLTAVALLFAIFKARPSPFALLDEV
ncbi:MAG: coiled-coil domain-containing protein, partial [Planctomycetota bacterium]